MQATVKTNGLPEQTNHTKVEEEEGEDEADEWEQVGPRNKSSITRVVSTRNLKTVDGTLVSLSKALKR